MNVETALTRRVFVLVKHPWQHDQGDTKADDLRDDEPRDMGGIDARERI